MDDFISDLSRLPQHCNYGSHHDEMIREIIVVGLRDKALVSAINQARQREIRQHIESLDKKVLGN